MLQILIECAWIAVLVGLAMVTARAKDRPVRVVAALCCANGVMTIALTQWLPHWSGPHPEVFLLDLATAVAYAIVAMRYGRWWLIFVAAVQIAGVALHVVYACHRTLSAGAYYTAFIILGFCLAAAIFAGAYTTRRESAILQ